MRSSTGTTGNTRTAQSRPGPHHDLLRCLDTPGSADVRADHGRRGRAHGIRQKTRRRLKGDGSSPLTSFQALIRRSRWADTHAPRLACEYYYSNASLRTPALAGDRPLHSFFVPPGARAFICKTFGSGP